MVATKTRRRLQPSSGRWVETIVYDPDKKTQVAKKSARAAFASGRYKRCTMWNSRCIKNSIAQTTR